MPSRHTDLDLHAAYAKAAHALNPELKVRYRADDGEPISRLGCLDPTQPCNAHHEERSGE